MSVLLATAILLPLTPAVAQVDCIPPQLDTQNGCIWPEQLGLAVILGQPLRGAAILTLLSADLVGPKYEEEFTYYRVGDSSLVLALEGENLVVRDMFYISR